MKKVPPGIPYAIEGRNELFRVTTLIPPATANDTLRTIMRFPVTGDTVST